jgi:chorismate--pyruvate lyase
MKLKQISPWISFEKMTILLANENIKSWLIEKGPITKRIKSKESFKLNLIKDEICSVDDSEKKFLEESSDKIKVREVILMGNNIPRVYAKSLIPIRTIENGFSRLGELGTKPLGDILFEKEIFKKTNVVYAQFQDQDSIFWGRKTKYIVKNMPLSVMEVFLIN